MTEKDQNKKKLRVIAVVIAIICTFLVFNVSATQFLAWYFQYSPTLGEPLLNGLYFPFNWIEWSSLYYSFHSNFFNFYFLGLFVSAILLISFGVLIKMSIQRRLKSIETLHGSAHWATKREIEEMGLLGNENGVFVGGWKENNTLHYLKHNGAEHLICIAPTRSGKGIGIIIPTLLNWNESLLCIDIKGENYALSAGFRKKYFNNRVMFFNPTDTTDKGVKFNPLEEIRIDSDYEVSDSQNIAKILLYRGISDNGKDMYFKDEGFTFLTAIFLYALKNARKKDLACPCLGDIYKIINDPQNQIDEVLEEMLNNENETISSVARSMLNKAESEKSGVIGTATAALNLYIDPIINKNTNKSDFKINDLVNGSNPSSLYIIIPPNDIKRLQPLFNLICNQIFSILTRDGMDFSDSQGSSKHKYRLLGMLDEVAALGKIDIIESGIAYLAGYGIKLFLAIQDISQLNHIYSQNNSIVSNCHIRICYAPNTNATAKLISDMAGTTTIIKKQITKSGKSTNLYMNSISETMQEISRPLITIDEVMRIKSAKKKDGKVIEAGDMIIFIAGNAPIYGKQTLFFKDEILLARSQVKLH
ncbi:conjugal transfer protein TraG [Helicobacter monodelphidis]|uniref:type IV secretory system conjugative DNA transfer family protein n=1 Tax=Helicobacter sp. 15-1451 TaxID=2004995 RepID=UPI000DCCD7C3|nr:type IV secretory system conjugative DNA transfer family protein [Helicobacter sp. 15-1451]RAX56589.1 conjugal transfer protein TraG [Helicobacter sp. 15-1451]